LLTVASSSQATLILVVMAVAGFLGIRRLGYGHLKHAPASQAQVDIQRQLDKLANAADEERLWRELKGAAQGLGQSSIRIFLMYQHESDSVSIQRVHGEWLGPSGFYGSFETSAASTTVKIEYRCRESMKGASLDELKDPAERACMKIFGKNPSAKAMENHSSKVVG
jgi:hypothetical protein